MNGNMIGRVLNNRYKITERIGIGGMAEVYRAQDQVLGRIVAVKVMLPQYAADSEFTLRFRQEAASAANLQSPFIVNVYDWGQDEGTYYIVMEYVRGSDLKTAIQTRGAITQRKAAEIGAQVCKALSVAHHQDIIHRDIKPQNIMVQPDGNVKVMDFGIARAKNSVKSQTSAVLGTAHYISPEQAQGKELTASSDIYSLGVVLYEAVTGQLPFDGPDSVSVAMKQVSEYPVPPSQVKPDIDPGLEAIIMRALEKDPLARFATVNDMKTALTDYLAGRPVNVEPDGTRMMDAGYAAPHPAPSSTSVMPAIEGGASSQSHTMVADASKASGEKKKKGAIIAIIAAVALVLIAIAAFASGMAASKTVPDVKGKTVPEATVLLQSSGYVLGTTTEVYDANVESGRVISSDPAAGSNLEAGSPVNLTVSKGKDQVAVPDVSGMTAREVQQALSRVGLTGKEGASEYSNTIAEGEAIRTEPSSGTKVDAGSTVTFILSKGSETTEVPNLSGMTEEEASEALEEAGFALGKVSEQASTSVSKGKVVSQNPSSGTKVAKGTTVAIVVSSGSPEAPDVIGQSQSRATANLQSAGFTVKVAEAASSTVEQGYVIDQYTSGSTVTITVSTGPAKSTSTSGSSKSGTSNSASSGSS
nr:Stk1 family PASTA domain-containing Ser/Thr kinase [Curtanaerobium respiraculi]